MRLEVVASFESVVYDGYDWFFNFSDHIVLHAESGALWRYEVNGHVVRVSTDHLQQFGLPAPVDLADEMTRLLSGRALEQVTIHDETGDLMLALKDGCELRVFTSSSGYESYSLSIGNDLYIGGGSGTVTHFHPA